MAKGSPLREWRLLVANGCEEEQADRAEEHLRRARNRTPVLLQLRTVGIPLHGPCETRWKQREIENQRWRLAQRQLQAIEEI